ncbi:C-8 sterol isomerase [Strigomonas culicis]|uniref:C-8 sterol isomerase n=1 Tax=Strigomonas culicis TaxID=28005 RepID=S9UXJ8_9TRYP|nr:C-8 sterol isomerase [Strigomonas culicis]EPY33568.1 C-8 sterol isomerase [Strigomonas culicis]|eukprot:EPY33548.1 C-8 sterol isomerase [Strigomonas culicis]
MGLFLTLFLLILFNTVALFVYIDQGTHNYVYEPARLQEISVAGIARAKAKHGEDTPATFIIDEVIQGVLDAYPQYSRYTGNWLFNNAGGAMGSMTVLHCSFTEYLIIFGTQTGTEGHTGRHLADDYFTILYGEQWAAFAQPSEKGREVYKPGEQHWMRKLDAKQYRMPEECWALEYARGNIASMMFFGFLDVLFSTADLPTAFQTVRESAGNMFPNLLLGKF